MFPCPSAQRLARGDILSEGLFGDSWVIKSFACYLKPFVSQADGTSLTQVVPHAARSQGVLSQGIRPNKVLRGASCIDGTWRQWRGAVGLAAVRNSWTARRPKISRTAMQI